MRKNIFVLTIIFCVANLVLINTVFLFIDMYQTGRPFGFSANSITFVASKNYQLEDENQEQVAQGQFYHDLIETNRIDPQIAMFLTSYSRLYVYEKERYQPGIMRVKKGSIYEKIYESGYTEYRGIPYKVESTEEWYETDPSFLMPLEDVLDSMWGIYYFDGVSEEEKQIIIDYLEDHDLIIERIESYSEKTEVKRILSDPTMSYAFKSCMIAVVCIFLGIRFFFNSRIPVYHIHYKYGGTPGSIALREAKQFSGSILISECVLPIYGIFLYLSGTTSYSSLSVISSLIAFCASLLMIFFLIFVSFPYGKVAEETK